MHVVRGALGALALALAAASAPAVVAGCSGDSTTPDTPNDAGTQGEGGSGGGGSPTTTTNSSASGAGGSGGVDAGDPDPGPKVDTSDPQLYKASFKPDEVDPQAAEALGTELAFLDTRYEPRGILVVYLHGAGAPTTCGSNAHGEMLAALGFHVMSPCYVSDYGVGNCGDDIEGCRLEAFEGVDHHAFIDIKPADSIEVRVAKSLTYIQSKIPQGDWTYFLDGDKPKWSKIIISGISHGASSSAVIGIHRLVHRVVSLSGPLDTGQAWLMKAPLTPIDRFYAFTHTGDDQHMGHLESFEAMGLPGMPTVVDGASPPYDSSHRLVSSAQTSDGHGATQAGGVSPKDVDGKYLYMPVWTTMYVGQP